MAKYTASDQPTAVLAAVLASEHCVGLARHIALGWLDRRNDACSIHAETDSGKDGRLTPRAPPILSGGAAPMAAPGPDRSSSRTDATERRRPDLILTFSEARQRFDPGSRSSVGLPHDDQVQAYVDELRNRRMDRAAVLLLASRSEYADFKLAQMPSQVLRITWEHTARLITTFEPDGAVGRSCRPSSCHISARRACGSQSGTPMHKSAEGVSDLRAGEVTRHGPVAPGKSSGG